MCVTSSSTPSKTAHWRIIFTDGEDLRDIKVTENASCHYPSEITGWVACYPGYEEPVWKNVDKGIWNQKTTNPTHFGSGICSYSTPPKKDHIVTHYCNPNVENCETTAGNYWNFSQSQCGTQETCPDYCPESGPGWEPLDTCYFGNGCNLGFGQPERDSPCCTNGTPILIDINGDGFDLTDAAGGVRFDIIGDGRPVRVGWPKQGSDEAWLALDRNSNGTIDNGTELFGNFTPQSTPPTGQHRNGFLALAEYDKLSNGGNGDGKIKVTDSIFTSLQLWKDSNHNGISEASELHSLSDLGLKSIDLDYMTSKKNDEHGNQFKYRAKVEDIHGAQMGRWAWDVIPVFSH